MKYEKIKEIDDEKFRRITGVKKITFKKMVEILNKSDKEKKSKGGRKSKLSIEDRLLMTLEYLREYRTYLHISKDYGLSESTCYVTIKWVEDTLIKSKCFALPGKKELTKDPEITDDLHLIDVTESPIERPKKDKNSFILEKRKNTP